MPLDGLEQLRPPEAPYLAETSESEPERPKHPSWNRVLKICPAPSVAQEQSVDLEEAQEMILPRMSEYEEQPSPAHALLVVAAPGTGKTTAAVQLAEAAAANNKRVFYAGPRHDFFTDLIRIAKHPDWWYEWLPRQSATREQPDIVETCQYAEIINSWLNKGYEGMIFCKSICGYDYVNNGCPYHDQKNRKSKIIFGQHQHVWLGHPLAKQFRLVIGDESPFHSVCRQWLIPARHVIPADMDIAEPITEIVHRLHSLIVQDSKMEGAVLLNALGGPHRVLEAVEAFAAVDAALPQPPVIHNLGDAEKASYFHLFDLARLLGREATVAMTGRDYPHRVVISNGYLMLLLRRQVFKNMPRHVVWLDATGNQRLYEAVLGRPVEVVAPRVRMQGRVFQVYDRANGKGAVIEKDKAGNTSVKATVKNLKRQVAKIVESEGYERVGIITHQSIEDEFDDYPDRGHYFGARGTNRFEGVNALVLVGVPQPSLTDLDTRARMIFWERMRPFRIGDENGVPVLPWSVIDKPFVHIAPDGLGRAYPASGFWGDADLQAVLWQYREAELIQAAHRARPNRYPVDIWLLENLPIDELPPTRLLPAREIFGAPKGVDCYRWEDVTASADLLMAEYGEVTAAALAEMLDVRIQRAREYMEKLYEVRKTDGWKMDRLIREGPRGRPINVLRASLKTTSLY